ncbi:MAG TPA: hypothetical protein VFK16_08500 [Gemmatimonadaceae bacterium]|jgi:hypothetical protein|nr:hypothetical protein [Gemmatimonadaceae bacterium]
MEHQDRHIEVHKHRGLGAAILTVIVTLALVSGAAYIHYSTFKSPNDLTFHAKGGGVE